MAAGCSSVALTDHDGLDGLVAAARRAEELGIGFVPGCEVSCVFAPGTMHVLCYFVLPKPGPLQDELKRLRADREHRNQILVERLQELGFEISLEEVRSRAGGTVVGRPHFAAVLMAHGAVSSIDEAFDRYLAKGRPAYISKARVEAREIIDRARQSGAVAVLAHPLSLGLSPEGLDRELLALKEAGLVGLECYYGRYDPATRQRLVELARHHQLVPTGGSDFHGSYKLDLSMGTGTGDLAVPDGVVDELAAHRPTVR